MQFLKKKLSSFFFFTFFYAPNWLAAYKMGLLPTSIATVLPYFIVPWGTSDMTTSLSLIVSLLMSFDDFIASKTAILAVQKKTNFGPTDTTSSRHTIN